MFPGLGAPPTLRGPPPWSAEAIEYVTFRNLKHVQERLRDHPGRPYKEQLTSIHSVQRLFNKTALSFISTIDRFHVEAHTKSLFSRKRAMDRRSREEELQDDLYVYTACAMTLADQTRTFSRSLNIDGYSEKKDAAFANNPVHRFVQELRVDAIHVTFHEPSWRLTSRGPNDQTTTFLLHLWQLPRVNEYHRLAKQYLAENPDGVELATLVRVYADQVNEFHTWLRSAIPVKVGALIDDYDRTSRIVRAVGTRNWWRILLSQVVIAGNRDPYAYLDRYLTSRELDEVQALPHRSTQQVDRIIQLVDEDGACNEELRTMVYKAFGIERA